jgi:type 1 glutamine amidotransferase
VTLSVTGNQISCHFLSYAWSNGTGENEVVDWTVSFGKGRIYVTMLGHLWKGKPDRAMRCVGFQTLLIRGAEWAGTGETTYPIPGDFPTAEQIRARSARANQQ